MVLSNEARGMIERCIDSMLLTIPPLVKYFRRDSNQKDLQYKRTQQHYFWIHMGSSFGCHSSYVITLQFSRKYTCRRNI